jgi:hypothetical protein
VLTRLDHNAVYSIFIKGQDPCCPPNAVTFGDSENDALDILLAVI